MRHGITYQSSLTSLNSSMVSDLGFFFIIRRLNFNTIELMIFEFNLSEG